MLKVLNGIIHIEHPRKDSVIRHIIYFIDRNVKENNII